MNPIRLKGICFPGNWEEDAGFGFHRLNTPVRLKPLDMLKTGSEHCAWPDIVLVMLHDPRVCSILDRRIKHLTGVSRGYQGSVWLTCNVTVPERVSSFRHWVEMGF